MTAGQMAYYLGMNPWRGVWLFVVFAACTKANPAATCKNGRCIDRAHPYCDADGAISGDPGACIAVTCTPGSVGACEGSNAALICNATGNGYDRMPCAINCDAINLTCTTMCTQHSQCASGICKADGTCAMDPEIAFTDPAGDPNSACTRLAPCTLEHALSLTPPSSGQYLELAAGDYSDSATLSVTGTRFLVGRGAAETFIRNTAIGTIFEISANADATFDSLTIADASFRTSPPAIEGFGINCPDTPAAPRGVHVLRSTLRNNGSGQLVATACTVDLRDSTFDGGPSGGADGANITGVVTVDRCRFTSNVGNGIYVQGDFTITNSFFDHNYAGAGLVNPTMSPIFAFNTVVDNGNTGILCLVNTGSAHTSVDNDIIARNGTNSINTGSDPSGCSFPSSIQLPDVTSLRFKHPDSAPFDYHLMSGSTAIDAASGCTTDHDYDNESRPKGNGCDVGADEAF